MKTRGGRLGRPRARATTILFALLVASPLTIVSHALAGPTDVSLAWNANSDPDLAGYQIAWGSSPGSHPNLIDVGNVTASTVSGLTTGNTYYFVLQAYDGARNYSGNSSEVSGIAGAAPTLTLSIGDAPDPVPAGTDVTYTLSYANTGTAGATSVVLTDTVPANTTFVSANAGGVRSGSTVTWSIGSVAAGGSGSVQMVARVSSPLPHGTTITNSGASIDSAQTNPVSASATTTVQSAPALAVSATDSPDPVNAGANITYTLSWSNTGNMNASGVVVTDTLPADTTFVSATAGGTRSGSVVTWNVGTLNAGASGSAQLVVRTNSPLPNGTTIANATYAIDSAETSPVAGATVNTTVTSAPALTLAVTDAPDPVLAGANLTYTLNWSNTGTMDATSLVIRDAVPANTTFVSATGGGTESGGVVTWTAPTLAVGGSGSAQMVVRVTTPLANGTVLTNSGGSADCSETAPVTAATVTTTVTSAPVLTIAAADAPDPVPAGSDLTYTLTWQNNGNADATGTVATATLPANTTFVSATAGGTRSGQVVTWSLGTVTPGANGSVQVVARVTSPLANGTLLSLATYSIDSAQTSPVSGAAVTTTVVSSPALALSQTDAPDPVNAGSNLTYTFSYSNSGNANATGTVLTGPLPANTTFVSATPPATTVSGGTATWNLGTLNGGASGSITLTVRVTSPLANGTVLTSAPSIDCAETTAVAAAPITTVVGSAPSLSMTITDAPDPVAAGANLTYTIGYTNNGNANASSTVLTVNVPANTTFVGATAGGSHAAGTVTWNVGAVNVGANGSVQMTVRVQSPLPNGTTLQSGPLSIDCVETAAIPGPTITTVVTSAPVLTLSATDAPDPVQAGANLTWTLTCANNGNADATGVVVTDTLPANTTFVSASGGGVVSGSTVTWTIGALPAGGSGSMSLTGRVASPLNNGTILTHSTYSIDSAQTNPVAGTGVTTTVASAPILALGVTASPDPVNSGSHITYTFSYSNTGNMNATGTTITDTLPNNTTFVSASGGGALSGSVVTWSLGALNAGTTGSVNLVVRVITPLADGTVIANGSASLDSAQTSPVSAPAVTTMVRSSPTLGLTLGDGPDPVQAGSNLTYTIGYSNTGSAASTSTVLTATLPANTSFVSATGGGTPGGSTVTWSLGTLQPGASSSVQLVVRVTSPLANGSTITAAAPSIDCAELAAVPGPGATTTVSSAPVLSLAQTDSPDPVAAGATLTYTLSYGNSGNANATGVVLTGPVPANTSFVSATGGGTLAGGTVTWPVGTVAAGGSGSVQMVVQVASPMTHGTQLPAGAATIDCAETAAVIASAISTSIVSSPSLTVVAMESADPIGAGMNLTYTLTYANGGNAVATGTILSAAVPANTTFVSAANGGVHSSGTVSWSLGSLGTNLFGSVSFVARVASPLPNGTVLTLGTYGIDSNQTSSSAGPPITTTVSSTPVLTLAVTDGPDPVLATNTITYTLQFANTGNAPADGVVVTASIPANTTYVSATGGAVLSGSLVTWDLGRLDAGAGGSVQLTVQVSATMTSGSIITASGWTIDSNDTGTVTAQAAHTSITEASAPTVASAVEVQTNSMYLVRGTTQTIRLVGTSFVHGAVVNLSPDISVGPATIGGSTTLTTDVTLAGGATLGLRAVTLTNPDGKMGSKADALRVVKKSDINNDCRADGIDLNTLARSWNNDVSEPGYNTTVDFDGDAYVGPDDLAIFIEQFGHRQPGCP